MRTERTLEIVRRMPALVGAALLALALAGPAAADDEGLTGFTTHGSGELSGMVTSLDGKPLAGVTVHITTASGAQQQVPTDKQGRYRAVVKNGGAYTMVFVRGAVRLGGQISVPTKIDDTEAIEIRETIPPAVMPRPVNLMWMIPEYSEAAKDSGVWARAWMMLDVDERGTVARLKLIGKPGHDLDRIAIRDAFKLHFEPARDRVGRPTRALLVWSYEWPSYWWMAERRHSAERMPAEVDKVPCRGTGGLRKYYRDCTKADLTRGVAEPWIDRPRK
jgi:hypothetical protein